MKINNKSKLQNIGIDHSEDIDYRDFVKIYKKYTKEPYSFLTTDTPSAGDPFRTFTKMTVTDQSKILVNKIQAN